MPDTRCLIEHGEQSFCLHQRGDRLSRTADEQDAVAPLGIVDAVGQIGREIIVADRLAGGQRAIAEDHEGLALPHALDLTRERFEERGGPHDRVVDAGFDQRAFESQLRPLELQFGLLNADRGKQDHVRYSRRLRLMQRAQMRVVIDPPRILGRPRPRREAGEHHIEPLAPDAIVRQRGGVGHIASAHFCSGRPIPLAPLAPDQADHLVPARDQRPHHCAADRARSPEDENPARLQAICLIERHRASLRNIATMREQ